MPEPSIFVTLLLTGTLAGICNAVAGGGTFFTFPAFLAAGIPPVMASASNAIAVWPGHAFAAVGYRRELTRLPASIRGSMAIAIVGGIIGAIFLAHVGNHAFSKAVPFLILFATVLFAAGTSINRWLQMRQIASDITRPTLGTRFVELLVAIYGGFFGAGLGVMLMAGLQMLGVNDVQANNALKNLLGALITTVAVIVLSLSGLVSWPHTLTAFMGAVVGGLIGGRVARHLSAKWLRRIVVATGALLGLYYFDQYY